MSEKPKETKPRKYTREIFHNITEKVFEYTLKTGRVPRGQNNEIKNIIYGDSKYFYAIKTPIESYKSDYLYIPNNDFEAFTTHLYQELDKIDPHKRTLCIITKMITVNGEIAACLTFQWKYLPPTQKDVQRKIKVINEKWESKNLLVDNISSFPYRFFTIALKLEEMDIPSDLDTSPDSWYRPDAWNSSHLLGAFSNSITPETSLPFYGAKVFAVESDFTHIYITIAY